MAAEGAPTGSGKAASNPFSWRLPKQIIALESFDFPHLHRRSDFNANKIGAIANPWMAGISTKRSPEQIRDMIRSGRFEPDDVGYLADLVMHFDCYYIRLFTMHCGISRYEIQRQQDRGHRQPVDGWHLHQAITGTDPRHDSLGKVRTRRRWIPCGPGHAFRLLLHSLVHHGKGHDRVQHPALLAGRVDELPVAAV